MPDIKVDYVVINKEVKLISIKDDEAYIEIDDIAITLTGIENIKIGIVK